MIVSFIGTSNIKQKPLSQVLTIAEITYKKSTNRSLFYVKDVAVDHFYRSLTTNAKKIQVAMVLCEILNKSLRLRVSNAVVISVDKKGSFDQYIKSAKARYLSLRLRKLKRSLLSKSA